MIRFCDVTKAKGMVHPDNLFDYLGLDENERPKTPNTKVVWFNPGREYVSKKGNDLVPFKPKWMFKHTCVENPGYGAYQHYLQVSIDDNGNIVTADYDFVRIADGALDENGNGTSGVVVFPVFEGFDHQTGENRLYVGFFLQYRPVIRNLDRKETTHGVWVATVPGGFGKLAQKSADTVKSEAAEEFGAELVELVETGWASDNRAKTETPVKYMLAKFKLGLNVVDDSHEKIFGKYAVPIEDFPIGADGIINNAYLFALSYLELI